MASLIDVAFKGDDFYDNLPPLVPKGTSIADRENIINEVVAAWLTPIPWTIDRSTEPAMAGVSLDQVSLWDAERNEAIDLATLVTRVISRVVAESDHGEQPIRVISIRGCSVELCDLACVDFAGNNIRLQTFAVRFGAYAMFAETNFGKNACFDHDVFRGQAIFFHAEFGDKASFVHTSFEAGVNFVYTQFGTDASFFGALFGTGSLLLNAKFASGAVFDDVVCPGLQFSNVDIDDSSFLVYRSSGRLIDALFPFYTLPCIFSSTRIRNARMYSRVREPWSVLRRNYTGSNMIFILIFTLLAFLPVGAKVIYWGGMSKLQEHAAPAVLKAIGEAHEILKTQSHPDWDGWVAEADVVLSELDVDSLDINEIGSVYDVFKGARSSITVFQKHLGSSGAVPEHVIDTEAWTNKADQISQIVAPGSEFRLEPRRVYGLVLGSGNGWFIVLLSSVMIGYNALRAFLTYQIGPMRDHSEQVGMSPAWHEYKYLWRIHQCISPVLGIAIMYGVFRVFSSLWLQVLVPV